MSDFLAEARVVIRPDTTAFRAQLAAQLAAATKGVTVPVNIVAAGGGAGAAAASTSQLTAAQAALNAQMAALRIQLQALTGSLVANVAATDAAAAAALLLAGAQDTLDKSTTRATTRLGQFQKGLVAALASLTGLRGAVLAASGPFLAAAVASFAFIKSLQEFAKFEQQLNIFAATAQATGEEMEAVSDLARELGQDLSLPAISAADAASALTELAKAGLSVEDSMGGVRGVLQLSTAAGISVAEAAQFAANELNAFGLAGDQAVRVADVLANAANSAQGSISDFGLAFKQSAAVANQVGLSLEATAAQLTVMARAGLQGSDAGTSLRVSLLRLINPTKKAQEVIDALGIDLRDVNGNIRPDVFVQFAEATERMTPALRDANAAIVFGADGIRTLAVSAQAGREGLVEATTAIGEQGTAAELAAARTAGFGGQLEGLKNSASGAAISLGEISTVIAGPLVLALTHLTTALNNTLEPLADLVRLSKEKLGVGTFDPINKSAGELIENLRRVQGEVATLRGRQGFEGVGAQDQIQAAITALKQERAELIALGGDASGTTALIQMLQNELTAIGGSLASSLSPAEEQLQKLQEQIDSLDGGVGTSALEEDMEGLRNRIALAAQEGGRFTERFDRGLRNAADGADVLGKALDRLRGSIRASSDELLRAQNEGASPQAQIQLLRGQEQAQFDVIENLKANGIQPGDPSAIREAREEIERIQGEIESLQAGIVSDQKAATTAAEKAAKEAQEARDKQFEALADMFGQRQEDIENAAERAGIAGNIQAQIRLNKQLIASLEKERKVLLERLKTLKVTAETRKKILEDISDAIEEAQQDILRAQEQQKKNIEEFTTPAIDIRIRIAQARDNVAQEIALRRQKIALITKELVRLKNAGKKNTLAWLELRAQRAEEIAAIKDLSKQDKEARSGIGFEFLQRMEGFSANLLGNLIPGFATAGLVGNTSAPAAAPDAAINAAVAEKRASTNVGPTFGQAATEVDVLREMLRVLRAIAAGRASPEAGFQRAQMAAVGDGTGGGGGGGQSVS